ncbi:MAG: ClpXP protease specificity-enhancing factor SspB [Pseudomonadota bacterium]|nr:ClpXP protease specificity-enhancing factor SspB [Pseudomonadota bacterium]
MAVDHIRYDILAQEALRRVVHDVLVDAAKNGLPGEHHFYISLDTRAEGLRISARLREQYPEEITIILQHQFWDLVVSEEKFEVGLAFGGVPEKLVVPFAAIKGFFDPSVQFGLQFETITAPQAEGENVPAEAPAARKPGEATEKPRKPARHQPVQKSASTPPAPATPGPKLVESPPNKRAGAEVVRLDRFRKK